MIQRVNMRPREVSIVWIGSNARDVAFFYDETFFAQEFTLQCFPLRPFPFKI